MRAPFPFSKFLFLIAAFLAAGLVIVPDYIRLKRIEFVSGGAGQTIGAPDPAAATLIIPGHRNRAYQWLDLTRQMFQQRDWRVRRVAYENAPAGHAVYAASPYRWWLGLVAGFAHIENGLPLQAALECAARYGDPLLLLLAAIATAAFVIRRFGFVAASLLVLGLASLYPLAAEFTPGIPDAGGLSLLVGFWSLLLPMVSLQETDGRRRRFWGAAAGVAGGLGLWLKVDLEAPLLAGIAVGGMLAMIVGGRTPLTPPWRWWGGVGAFTCLACYLVEYFPHAMGEWELRAIHPAFGLSWLGGAEFLQRLGVRLGGQSRAHGLKAWLGLLAAALGLATVPVILWATHSWSFLGLELDFMRLNVLAESPTGTSLWAWLLQNGVTTKASAALLPMAVALLAVPLCWNSRLPRPHRLALAFGIGPALLCFAFACRRIVWWNGCDLTVLALLAPLGALLEIPTCPRLVRAAAAVAGVALLTLGAAALWPEQKIRDPLYGDQVQALVERDVARWLSQYAGPDDVVLAPPNATVGLQYYGGIKGLGTFDWENRDGLNVAVRMASGTTPEESQELFNLRHVRYIVMPSWDPYLRAYTEIGQGELQGTFLERIYHWNIPTWLRPVPYLMPSIPGFEGQRVTVFEVVDEQDTATAAARLAEYFVAMNQLDLAGDADRELSKYPGDLGATLARTEVAIARGDAAETEKVLAVLQSRIRTGADRDLPWDERVALAIVLAQTHHLDQARTRLKPLVEAIDEEKIRSLDVGALYRFLLLGRAVGLEIKDPRLHAMALALLPPDLRSRF